MDGSSGPATKSASSYLLRSIPREHGFEPLEVEGTIPEGLEGTFFRVGPGLFDSVGVPITHSFEADGAVTAVRLSGGRAEGAVKVVDSVGLREERAAGRPIYGFRAPYLSRMLAALRGKLKNTANTAPMLYQGRLFAMVEAAKPTEIDPLTLETIGETDLGVIPAAFSAHPHRVASRRAQYNFGIRYGKKTQLDLFALPDVGPARLIGSVPLPRPVMMHDFIVTESRLIFLVSPFEVVIPRALLQVGPFDKLFEFKPAHGTEVIVVPIDAPSNVRRFTVDAFYQWHFANAFDVDGGLVLDFARYRDASSFHEIGIDDGIGGELVRVRLEDGAKRLRDERVVEGRHEFPTIDPRFAAAKHRIVFTATESATARGIARTDLESGSTTRFEEGKHTAYLEPVFVPRPGGKEGEGHLLVGVLDARRARSHVAVFDAERLADGPVARAWFDEALPITFHGVFVGA